MNVIFGASGHAREIDWIINNSLSDNLSARIFVLESLPNDSVGNDNLISEYALAKLLAEGNEGQNWYAYVAIGNNAIRQKIVNKFNDFRMLHFPNLVASSVVLNEIKVGAGNIFFPKTLFTINILIGNHNHFNLNVSVSHDCKIGNFNTFSPGVIISGNVKIGNNNFFGVGACVIDGITIADNVVIGAGAIVIHDLLIPGTYVGIPAKKIK